MKLEVSSTSPLKVTLKNKTLSIYFEFSDNLSEEQVQKMVIFFHIKGIFFDTTEFLYLDSTSPQYIDQIIRLLVERGNSFVNDADDAINYLEDLAVFSRSIKVIEKDEVI